MRDITDKKIQEEKLKAAYRKLKIANKELEQFVYLSSHDLKEPLRTISGFLQLILKNSYSCLDKNGREYIKYAINGSRRMGHIIDDLLENIKLKSENIVVEEIDLNAIFEEILLDIKQKYNEVELKIFLDNMPRITGDKLLLKKVFYNILDNSVKYRSFERVCEIEVSYKKRGQKNLISIEDNGVGINEKYLKKIFELFFRLDNIEREKSTGAGLTLCKQIIEKHKGKIWLESEEGIGTTFYILLS